MTHGLCSGETKPSQSDEVYFVSVHCRYKWLCPEVGAVSASHKLEGRPRRCGAPRSELGHVLRAALSILSSGCGSFLCVLPGAPGFVLHPWRWDASVCVSSPWGGVIGCKLYGSRCLFFAVYSLSCCYFHSYVTLRSLQM